MPTSTVRMVQWWTNSAFDCAVFSYTTGDRWKVTARVNGSGVSLAVYINSAGTVIGTEGDGTTESVDYTDYANTSIWHRKIIHHIQPFIDCQKICCYSRAVKRSARDDGKVSRALFWEIAMSLITNGNLLPRQKWDARLF
ncbi:hypothetical protein ACQU6D_14580 [Klebsiella variicola]|uniref:hypothetical protein n=1 Tax=Klebsiella variicola TaxID=244366 RepID=UPI003D2BC693